MSSPKKDSELKAGHPPAVKAGGMRITQHKSPKSDDKHLLDDSDINNAGLKVSTSPPKNLTISGAPPRGNADFPAEAVQSFHDKPLPAHDPRPAHGNRPNIIHQPRKQ
ncbi:death-associated protein 1 [Lycorma delicatula]|uniref:death-associated protein 1 n=1 Tax=Lycorma delicatula TaxID=130591 RepID=UPI003F50FB37